MRKGALVPVLVLVLLLLMGTGGYYFLNGDGGGIDILDGEDGGDEQQEDVADEWSLHFIADSDDLPNCDSESMSRLYYVEADAGFHTCTNAGWSFVNLTGQPNPPGNSGTDGQNGTDGQAGETGETGDQGEPGADGHSALAATGEEPAGSNCANGGIKIWVGVDDDDDGFLDASEIEHTQYVCNGSDGQDGSSGGSSVDTMLTRISTPTLQACSSGGRIMEQGLDNGEGGGTAQNGALEDGEVDYTTTYCSNFVVSRLADINPGSDNSNPGKYTGFVAVGNTLYFDANEPTYGTELWAHEMNTGSTSIAANIHGGFYTSNPGAYGGIVVVGTTLYFEAWTGATELWAYETTNSTAWQAADIYPGSPGSAPGYWGGIVKVGKTLYFDAMDDNTGSELWAHDTESGTTWQVADINSGSDSSAPGYYAGINVVGTKLYFCATDGNSGYELWSHDTVAGTTGRVADINWGSEDSIPGKLSGLTAVGTTLYFDADDGNSGRELWAHDTSTGSTTRVADIYSGSGSSDPGDDAGFTAVGTKIYFDAYDVTAGRELWAYDTTSGSASRVADIYVGSSGSYPGYSSGGLTAVGTTLYFDAIDAAKGRELWAHNTTSGASWRVNDINSSGSSRPGDNAGITAVGTRLFFDADDPSSGTELWMYDTTTGETRQVADINSNGGSNPGRLTGLTVVGSRLYFQANDGSGYELWSMDIEHTITYN
uniref:Hyalin repeat-containing protein n=1 Tax=uncultured marine group II/III euryarchaeote KM3_192_B10 TaxID=1457963 RepID=A0A075GVV5_9EURY|nr:hyalin repeat-containing protein [uncultured marine group II/III euryarchaeote KM3_192_B10]